MKYSLIILFVLSGITCNAQKYCCHEPQIAFDGYDITSYYGDSGIKKGNALFSHEYEGMTLWFMNNGTRNDFIENPESYFPEYGGWCAIAMSLGSLVPPNYTYYILQEDGRLLFFTVQGFVNGITLWEKAPDANTKKADIYYQSVH